MLGQKLGQRINYIRTSQGIKLVDLARAIGVSTSTVTRYERGAIQMDMSRFLEVAAALNVSPCQLFPVDTVNYDPDNLTVFQKDALRAFVASTK